MAFINEYISEEDLKKYSIEEIDENYMVGATNARDWTVDHERKIYLRNVANGREEFAHRTDWTFYWQGELITFRMEIKKTGGKFKGPSWGHKKITRIDIPDSILSQRTEILEDIRKALEAYKDGGVFARATTYELTLDVVEA